MKTLRSEPSLPKRTLFELGFLNRDPVIPGIASLKPSDMMDVFLNVTRHATDLVVVIHGFRFKCSIILLQICTEYFRDFRSKQTIVINEKDVTPPGFKRVYDWMCTPRARLNRETLVDMFYAAQFLKMPELIAQIWSYMDDEKLVGENDAFLFYFESIKFGPSSFSELMASRIGRFFLTAVATEQFLLLPAPNLIEIISENSIAVNSEIEVFLSVVRWLRYNWPSRKSEAPKVLAAVRFDLMPPWYLTSLQEREPTPELRELLKLPELQRMISKSLSYTITEQFMNDMSPLAKPLKMEKKLQRLWVYDDNLRHHHQQKCKHWQYLSYELFDDMLRMIIERGENYWSTLKCVHAEEPMACCHKANELEFPRVRFSV